MLQKSLDYGLNGYQVPSVPRAPRSSRRRGSIRKKAQDSQMCAFDLLATVAGTLLLENEISPNSSVQKDQALNVKDVVMEEQHDEVIPLKPEHYDQGSMELPFLSLELGLQDHALKKEVSVPQNDASLTPASMITSSDCSGKDGPLNNIVLNDEKSKFCNQSTNPEQCCDGVKDSCLPDACERVEPVGSQGEMCLDSTKLSLGTDHYNCGSFAPSRGQNVKLVTRDDDENSSGCTHPDTLKPTNRLSHIRGRKIRKLWASKYHRVAPKMKNGDFSESEWRYIYCSRKTGFKRQRSQRIYPFKKRKIYHYSSLSKSDEKAIGTNASFGSLGHGVNGSSSSVSSQSTGFQSKESHVKFRIKSFRVPELFIEMPETATIGSLKRTVLEALTTLLEDGLHVGVLLQGKKIRDDNRTLLQSGICRNDKVESLGFTLEPTSMHRNPPLCSEDSSLVLSSDLPQPLSRSPEAITVHQGASHPSSLDHPVSNALHLIESDHDSAPSPAEISTEKGTVDSRAIVPLPEGSPQALAVLPANLKTKRSDMAQRRIRRPFSVTEVEALVQAVEKLGTGRWRDVKLCAFENVKHRTYVDLKDKWKTLVHTARISPQQRRGEPVPQELLERVLAAHAYWSQQQAKQQLKQQSEACLLL